jgi:hypothetical protein
MMHDEVTEAQILNQIRIYPRDRYHLGFFEHEPTSSKVTEKDSVLHAYRAWLRTTKGENLQAVTKDLINKQRKCI